MGTLLIVASGARASQADSLRVKMDDGTTSVAVINAIRSIVG